MIILFLKLIIQLKYSEIIFLHWGKILKGECHLGDQVKASIDIKSRNLIRNNHSSTHLLHASLRKILGKHVSQKGSLVNSEKLRFDFSHNELISNENLEKIELLVNKIIKQKDPIITEIKDHKEAVNSGAIALFGEKYGDEVRVITMGKDEDKVFSVELCGGTHVKNTGDIKKFKIINQFSVASGIRRIEALTSITVDKFNSKKDFEDKKYLKKINNEIDKYINLIENIDPKKHKKIITNLNTFDDSLDQKLKEIKKIYDETKQNIDISLSKKDINFEKVGKYNLIYLFTNKYPSKKLKSFIDEQKKLNPKKSIIILVSTDINKVSIIVGVTDDITNIYDATNIVKTAASIVGGKGGGGRKDLAQAGGNIPEKATKIYAEIKKNIANIS